MPGHAREISSSGPAAQRRPVLVPVDFSSCSAAALLFAAHLAGCVQAPLLVLHVVHEPRNEPGFYRRRSRSGAALSRPLEDVARDMLADFLNELSRHESARQVLTDARTRLVTGLPAQRIQEVALQEDVALIVIGSRGRSGWSRLAEVSVAGEVAKHSPVPVTVVKGPGPQHRRLDAEVIIGSSEWWTRRVPRRAVGSGLAGEEPGA